MKLKLPNNTAQVNMKLFLGHWMNSAKEFRMKVLLQKQVILFISRLFSLNELVKMNLNYSIKNQF